MGVLIGVFLVGLIIFHVLERFAPVHPDYRTGVRRRGYLADFIAAIVNGPGLTGIERIAFVYLVTRLPAGVDLMAGWHWWAQFALFFLANDFLRYWFHRWYHRYEWLWRIHRVHHTVVEMDALSVFRHHVLEAIVKNGLIFLPFRLLGVEVSVIIAYSAIDVFKGFWHHANLRSYIGPLNYIFNSPELHWWHHETGVKGQNSNYGSVLSIWDLLFGTFYYRPHEWPERIGVEGMERFPDTYLRQFASIRHNDAEMLARLNNDRTATPAPLPVSSTSAPASG